MASIKYRDDFDALGHSMSWPTDVLARYLVPPQALSQEQIARLVDGNNRSPKKGGGGGGYGYGSPASPSPISGGGQPPLLGGRKDSSSDSVPTTARIVSQELSNLVWGSVLTLVALLIFQVGFTNKLAVGLWSPAVALSFAAATVATRLRNGSTTPLLLWHTAMLFFFQLTLAIGTLRCLVLEATGGRSYAVVALSMVTIMFSIPTSNGDGPASAVAGLYGGVNGISPPPSPAAVDMSGGGDSSGGDSFFSRFVHRWGWVAANGLIQTLFYLVLGLVDAFASCRFSTDSLTFGSLPPLAVIILLQQFAPIAMLLGSMARAYSHAATAAQQRRISEDFAVRCLRATMQRDVSGLVLC